MSLVEVLEISKLLDHLHTKQGDPKIHPRYSIFHLYSSHLFFMKTFHTCWCFKLAVGSFPLRGTIAFVVAALFCACSPIQTRLATALSNILKKNVFTMTILISVQMEECALLYVVGELQYVKLRTTYNGADPQKDYAGISIDTPV